MSLRLATAKYSFGLTRPYASIPLRSVSTIAEPKTVPLEPRCPSPAMSPDADPDAEACIESEFAAQPASPIEARSRGATTQAQRPIRPPFTALVCHASGRAVPVLVRRPHRPRSVQGLPSQCTEGAEPRGRAMGKKDQRVRDIRRGAAR